MAPIDYFLHKPTFNRIMSLSLDDYEDQEIELQRTGRIENLPLTHLYIQVDQFLKGLLSADKCNELLIKLKEYHCENIINFSYFINLGKGKRLDFDIVFYIFSILAIGDKIGLSNLSIDKPIDDEFDKVSYTRFMLSLAHKVSFWLADEDEMLTTGISENIPSIGYFGYYDSCESGIILCPKRIDEAVEILQTSKGVLKGFSNKGDARKVLYAIVIIHLLAQAMLDSTNLLSSESNSGDKIPCGRLCKYKEEINGKECFEKIDTESYLLTEKSLANMITLSYFDEYSKQFQTIDYRQVREFMLNQPDAYKFGIIQYDSLRPNWRSWRECKRNLAILCTK